LTSGGSQSTFDPPAFRYDTGYFFIYSLNPVFDRDSAVNTAVIKFNRIVSFQKCSLVGYHSVACRHVALLNPYSCKRFNLMEYVFRIVLWQAVPDAALNKFFALFFSSFEEFFLPTAFLILIRFSPAISASAIAVNKSHPDRVISPVRLF